MKYNLFPTKLKLYKHWKHKITENAIESQKLWLNNAFCASTPNSGNICYGMAPLTSNFKLYLVTSHCSYTEKHNGF
jgi:hypothetical protein